MVLYKTPLAKAAAVALLLSCTLLAGCTRDATVASRNLSAAADNFELDRRIVFYNGITGAYMLSIEGKCSFDAGTTQQSRCHL